MSLVKLFKLVFFIWKIKGVFTMFDDFICLKNYWCLEWHPLGLIEMVHWNSFLWRLTPMWYLHLAIGIIVNAADVLLLGKWLHWDAFVKIQWSSNCAASICRQLVFREESTIRSLLYQCQRTCLLPLLTHHHVLVVGLMLSIQKKQRTFYTGSFE